MYVRKTYDEWDIEGNYGLGWEVLCSEDNRADAKRTLRDYDVNEPQYEHRIVKHRYRKEAVEC